MSNRALGHRILLLLVLMKSLIAQADYSNAVMSLGPVAYWPLNERPRGYVAMIPRTNDSNLSLNYFGNIKSEAAGAIVAETNPAVTLDGSTAYLIIPFDPALGLAAPFSVEGWFKPGSISAACVLSCGDFGSRRSGWAIYCEPFHGWNFRLHTQNSPSPSLSIEGGDTSLGVWHHIVAVHDGTNACLYVDGSLAVGPAAVKEYTPDQYGALTIGTRSDNVFPFEGGVDEVALYTNALPASVIEGHYRSATNRSPSESYASLIRRQHPFLYFRLNETAVAGTAVVTSSSQSPGAQEFNTDYFRMRESPMAFNYGSFGADVNGTYTLGAQPGSPGPPFPGFGPASLACRFEPNVRSYVDCTSDSRLNITGPMTAIAWIRASPGGNRFQAFLGRSDDSWRADVDWEGRVRWADGKNDPDAVGVTHVKNGMWHFFAGISDGGTNYVYLDGKLEGVSRAFSGVAGREGKTIIGSVEDYLFDRQFEGSVAQVAIFTNALSAQDILRLYQSAEAGPGPSR